MSRWMSKLINKKIQERMDTLEDMMNNNSHLVDEEAVKEQISSVSKFWSVFTK